MSTVFALDPGPDQTGWAVYDGERVMGSGVLANAVLLEYLITGLPPVRCSEPVVAIEMIASYGMPVGREVFETCVWIGRFQQAWHSPESVQLVYRKDVKLHLCQNTRAKDPHVRQAILDLFPRSGGGATPQVGTKGKPGPLYGVSTHAWPALAVALLVHHRWQKELASCARAA